MILICNSRLYRYYRGITFLYLHVNYTAHCTIYCFYDLKKIEIKQELFMSLSHTPVQLFQKSLHIVSTCICPSVRPSVSPSVRLATEFRDFAFGEMKGRRLRSQKSEGHMWTFKHKLCIQYL